MSRRNIDGRRIRWIAFDAVGTLIHPFPSVAAIYHRVAQRHGSRLTIEEIAPRFRQAFASVEQSAALPCAVRRSSEASHTCEERERLRWQVIVRTVLDDVSSADACFPELFSQFGQPSAWRCFPEVEETLGTLRRSGFRLAVSSNFDARLHPVMDGLPALRPIELRIVSSQVGHRKPSVRFYESLLAAAECSPAEMVIVGDDRQNDVEAAEAAGIAALQIDRSDRGGHNSALRSLAEIIERLHR